MTKGQTLLAAIMARENLTQSDVARRLDVKQATVCRWVAGTRTPERDAATRFQTEFDIPISAWSEPADDELHAAEG